jgi:hypothetical protein
VACAQALQSRGKLDAGGLVDLGVKAVSMLEACSKAATAAEVAAAAASKGAAPAAPELGACLAGGHF